ncbi:MAG: efflux RND transporter permease subunit [Oligoflexia bacterium]|nr:efflux RND transporter permease subunit [Oligoflexia bacterium]
MKKIIEYFIDKSLIVNLVTVMIFVIGGFSLNSLQKETFPSVEFDVIVVTTIYPGSSSEDVEKLITIPLEREIKGISGIKELNALSAESSSIIYIEVDPDSNLKDVLDDVKNSVDAVNDLPSDAEVPVIRSIDNKQRGVIKIALTGINYKDLRTASKHLRDELENMKEMANINLLGHLPDEIRVQVNPVAMKENEVTIGEVAKALRERNLNLSSGSIKPETGEVFVRTVSEFRNLDEIRNLVLVSNETGRSITVGDIATVERGPDPEGIIERSNSKPSIFLDVKIKEKADILRTTDKLKRNVEKFKKENQDRYTENLNIGYVDDASYYVKRRLNILKDNGVVGMILVFICLMFFLNVRTSIVTSLGAPIAFMVSFAIMEMMGLSLNLISMFALILVLGMLVDDSIIVAEQFYQHLEDGKKPREAARLASFETIKPIFATIITTMVAFGALFFMGGIMGKFLWPVPAVVIICLFASLIECFFILPSHLADFCKLSANENAMASEGGKRWYEKATNIYESVLRVVLKKYYLPVLAFFFLLIGSIFTATKMDFELFPGDDVRTVFIQLKGKVGEKLETTNNVALAIEEMILKDLDKTELDQIKSSVGSLQGDQGTKLGTHYSSIIIYLTPPGDRERTTDEILTAVTEKAKTLAPGYVVTTKKIQGGPPKGKPVDIELLGDSLEELKLVSTKVEQALAKEEGIVSTEIDFEEGKKQIVVNVNDFEARRLGLTTRQIALELRTVLSGDSITEIRESDEDIEIKLLIENEARKSLESLKNFSILNNRGNRIPLTKVVKFEEQPGAFVIRRKNRKRIFSVSAEIDKAKTTPVKVAKTFAPKVRELVKDYPNVRFQFGGENQDTKESMMRLFRSFFIALSTIFLILVIMFNSLLHPFVIMTAIPLGLIGVIWTFLVSGTALGFMAMMGVVALMGVVVNDSIVLVSFINNKLKTRDDLFEVVIEASRSRFRPIILTTFTTVAGLLPIAHPTVSFILSFGTNTDSDPFLQPMAMSFAWGLLFASLVTLFFIPACYITFENMKRWVVKKLKSMRGADKSSTPVTM